jgi:hypothetical protein
VSGFDRHRVRAGAGGCRPPAEVGLVRREARAAEARGAAWAFPADGREHWHGPWLDGLAAGSGV